MHGSAFHFASPGLSRITSGANDYPAVSECQINRDKSLNRLTGNVFFVRLLAVRLGVRILPRQRCTCLCEDNMKHLECKFTKTHKAEPKLCSTMMNVLPLTCWHPNKHSWPTLVFAYFSVLLYKWSFVQHYCLITTLQKSHFNGGFIVSPFGFPAADVNA